MKINKLTCIVHRDISPLVSSTLAEAGISLYTVESGRSVVLRERKRLFGLSSTTVLEDDPVDIYRLYVRPRTMDGLLSLLIVKAGLTTAGRGTVFCEDVVLEGAATGILNQNVVTGPEDRPHVASDLVGISCIVQRGQAGPIIHSLLDSGSVPTVTFGEGMGVRDKLGLLRIAIPAEKEVVSALVTRYDAEQIMNILIDVGRLEQPGKGFIYLSPIRKGLVNTKTSRGQRAQGASMEQIVAALDHLKGSSEWRKIEAMDKAKNKRKYLRDLVDLSLHMNDGKAEGIAQAAMAVGAPGATISRNRLRTDASVDGIARELCDIIVGKTQVGNLEETVRTAGLFQDDAAGLIETSTVSLACTYLGGK